MTAEPGDDTAAAQRRGHGDLRASHADREQAIELLKAAFVQDRLTLEELDVRVGRALTARTGAELAELTAGIPAGTGPARPPAPARRRPLVRAAAGSGSCLIIAAAAAWAAIILPAGQGGSSPWIGLMVLLAVSGLWTAVGIMGYAVFTAWDERSSRRSAAPLARNTG
jgi:Domain of unknown function (DUF1707)